MRKTLDRVGADAQTSQNHASSKRAILLFTVAGGMLAFGIVASAGIGQMTIGVTEVLGSILRFFGLETAWAPSEIAYATLWNIRFPRIVMSIIVGVMLAVAGAVMQALFSNPLAEPGVVGVSSGAALGAALALAFGSGVLGEWTVAGFAFLGSLLTTFVVYSASRSRGRTESVTLILTGIAINAFAGAGLALVMVLSSASSREQIVFWQLGTMNGSRWSEVLVVASIGLLALIGVMILAPQYDLLALGDRTAVHLGVRVERLRITSIVLVALLTGVAVAFVGIVAFVGLVVPHIARMILGPSNQLLISASILLGGTMLVWADLFARTIVPAADLPLGVLTSIVGGPFFYWLIRRTRRTSGGWA